MSIDEFEDYYNSEINNSIIDGFKKIDKTIENENVSLAIRIFIDFTSDEVLTLFLIIIIFLIVILIIINLSFIKCIKVTSIALLFSGGLMSIIFSVVTIIKDRILKNSLDIDFSNFLLTGIIEVLVGLMLIITYCVLNNKKKRKETITKQINSIFMNDR